MANDNLPIRIRNGLFLAPSRTTGEQLLEPLLRYKYSLLDPVGNDHDAIAKNGTKYEIKTSKVLKKPANRNSGKAQLSILERVLIEEETQMTHRLVPYKECKTADYDANIQNVKRDHFDELIYVLLFEDCIKIFFAKVNEIKTGSLPGWSDKHGRYDRVGKSGQFNITKRTVQWHIDNCLRDTMTYTEAAEIFELLSRPHVN